MDLRLSVQICGRFLFGGYDFSGARDVEQEFIRLIFDNARKASREKPG
jgi:hypothetical protein